MTDDEFTRLQDDGSPNCREHLPEFDPYCSFYVGGNIIRVRMGRAILDEIRTRPRPFTSVVQEV